jgi:hypothetical protein
MKSKSDQTVKLGYDNWYLWDRCIKSTIRRKNAYIAFDPEPVDPRTQQQIAPPTTGAPTTTPSISVMPQPTTEELKRYREELKEWRTANNVAAGVILGAISDEVQHVVNPGEPARDMYDKLEAEVVKQCSANSTRIDLVDKQFKDAPTMENFEKHLTFYRSKNATLNAVGAGLDDSFLAWLLLHSFHSNDNPMWSMASTNIITSDTPINQWSFNHVAGELRKALRNNIRPTKGSTSNTNQTALNATADKTNTNRYNGPHCTHLGCRRPKTHATENCWTKEKEKREKKKNKHKAKKAKNKAAESSSEYETSSDSDSDSDSDSEPPPKKRHHTHRFRVNSKKTVRILKATSHHARSYHGKGAAENIFVAHPDSGASNHVTHRRELFDSPSFETTYYSIHDLASSGSATSL